jgi:hypothetical protein
MGEGRTGRPFIRASSGDKGRASVVLRRLGRRMYGRHRGWTGGPPCAQRAYGGATSRLEASWVEARVGVCGPRAAHDLEQRSRREGAQARPSRVGRHWLATRGARARDVAAH